MLFLAQNRHRRNGPRLSENRERDRLSVNCRTKTQKFKQNSRDELVTGLKNFVGCKKSHIFMTSTAIVLNKIEVSESSPDFSNFNIDVIRKAATSKGRRDMMAYDDI